MRKIILSGGPLDGQERELEETGAALEAEFPGYSPVEDKLDPEQGHVMNLEWVGSDADEAAYPETREQSAQERERYGNQTGVRDQQAQDALRAEESREHGAGQVTEDSKNPEDRAADQARSKTADQARQDTQGDKKTGAEQRDAKNAKMASKTDDGKSKK
jgi:hypothetical protein